MDCPDDDVLARWLSEEGGGDDALHAHLDACPRCAALVVELGRVYEPEAGDESSDDPLSDRYRIDGILGAGGMGVVYRGLDLRLDRPVAIKGLHTDLDGSRGLVSRLRAEARLMARVHHPNIVEVFEILTLDEGIYVVMELVEGLDLRAWLGQRPRGEAEIVEVFRAAGLGLAAAHAVGVVHRDFKPDNVLVGADGRVRVTDFGLAYHPDDGSESWPDVSREGDALASERAPSVAVREIVGTARYMAPEQRVGGRVDARADQYAFAVSLAEALGSDLDSGEAPRRRVSGRVRRVLARARSDRPSQRFRDMHRLLDALQPRARGPRGLAIGGLAALGVVVLSWQAAPMSVAPPRCDAEPLRSAVELERSRRRLAEGVGEALADRSHARLAQLVEDERAQRQRLCGAGADAPEVAARRSCLAQQRAEIEATLEAIDEQDGDALVQIVDAVAELPDGERCRSPQPWSEPGPEGAVAIEGARVALARARALRRSGLPGRAETSIEEAQVELEGLEPGPVHAEVLLERGRLLRSRDRWADAASDLERAYWLATEARRFALAEQAAAELVMARLDDGTEADALDDWLRHAEAAHERAGEGGDAFMLETALGRHEAARGRATEALAHFERAQEQARVRYGETHPVYWSATHNLAIAADGGGDYARAVALAERAVAGRGAALGPEHPSVARSLRTLANAEARLGEVEAADDHLREAIAIMEALHGERDPSLVPYFDSLALHLSEQGRDAEALLLLRRSVSTLEQSLGPDHPETLRSKRELGNGLRRVGELAQARAVLEEVSSALQGTVSSEHPMRIVVLADLANLASLEGRPAEAEPLLRQALQHYQQRYPDGHSLVAITQHQLGRVQWQLGDTDAALRSFERAEALLVAEVGERSPALAKLLLARADLLFELARDDEAEAACLEAQRVMEASSGPLSSVLRRRGQLALVRGDLDEALQTLEQAAVEAGARDDLEARTHVDLLRAHALIASGRDAEGEALLQELATRPLELEPLRAEVDPVLQRAGLSPAREAPAGAPR